MTGDLGHTLTTPQSTHILTNKFIHCPVWTSNKPLDLLPQEDLASVFSIPLNDVNVASAAQDKTLESILWPLSLIFCIQSTICQPHLQTPPKSNILSALSLSFINMTACCLVCTHPLLCYHPFSTPKGFSTTVPMVYRTPEDLPFYFPISSHGALLPGMFCPIQQSSSLLPSLSAKVTYSGAARITSPVYPLFPHGSGPFLIYNYGTCHLLTCLCLSHHYRVNYLKPGPCHFQV